MKFLRRIFGISQNLQSAAMRQQKENNLEVLVAHVHISKSCVSQNVKTFLTE